MTCVRGRAIGSKAPPELELPHERVRLDLQAGDQKQADFLALNPNGKVPTLVVDGTPMFEALAIMQWLGDRYGVERGLWPAADASERLEALSWSTWMYVSFIAVSKRLANGVTYATFVGVSTKGHDNVVKWLASVHERPAYKKAWTME